MAFHLSRSISNLLYQFQSALPGDSNDQYLECRLVVGDDRQVLIELTIVKDVVNAHCGVKKIFLEDAQIIMCRV